MLYILDGIAGLYRLALCVAFVLLRLHMGPSWRLLYGLACLNLEVVPNFNPKIISIHLAFRIASVEWSMGFFAASLLLHIVLGNWIMTVTIGLE